MNPDRPNQNDNRRERPKIFRGIGIGIPYPVHRNMFIRQAINQERRRLHTNNRQPTPPPPPPPPPRNPSAADDNLVLDFTVGGHRFQYTVRRHNSANVVIEFFRPGARSTGNLPLNLQITTANAENGQPQQAVDVSSYLKHLLATDEDVNDNCTICITNFAPEQHLVQLPCKHKFHRSCVTPWLRQNKACPLCRSDVTANPMGLNTDNQSAEENNPAGGANEGGPADDCEQAD